MFVSVEDLYVSMSFYPIETDDGARELLLHRAAFAPVRIQER